MPLGQSSKASSGRVEATADTTFKASIDSRPPTLFEEVDPSEAPTGFAEDVTEELQRQGLDLLRQFDSAPVQPLHLKACFIAGIGFIADGYTMFVQRCIGPMIAVGVFANWGQLPLFRIGQLIWIGALGTCLGRMFFGWLGDRRGRGAVFGYATMVLALGMLFTASTSFGTGNTLMTLILFWHCVMMFGLGGELPNGAVMISEYAPREKRGPLIALAFSMEFVGYGFCAVVACAVIFALHPAWDKCALWKPCVEANHAWRVIMALGAIPALITFYIRTHVPETPRFLLHVEQPRMHRGDKRCRKAVPVGRKPTQEQLDSLAKYMLPRKPDSLADSQWSNAGAPAPSNCSLPAALTNLWAKFQRLRTDPPPESLLGYLLQGSHLKPILAMSMTWFITEYCMSLQLNATIFRNFIALDKLTNFKQPKHVIFTIILNNFKVACFNTFVNGPGYLLAMLLINRAGRRALMGCGFLVVAMVQALMGMQVDRLNAVQPVWLALYSIGNVALTAGPRIINVVVPAECFPTRFRGTLYGFISGFGILGQMIGWFSYKSGVHYGGKYDDRVVLCFSAACAVLGAVITWAWVPEPGTRSLEASEQLGGGEAALLGYDDDEESEGGTQASIDDVMAGGGGGDVGVGVGVGAMGGQQWDGAASSPQAGPGSIEAGPGRLPTAGVARSTRSGRSGRLSDRSNVTHVSNMSQVSVESLMESVKSVVQGSRNSAENGVPQVELRQVQVVVPPSQTWRFGTVPQQ